MGRDLHSFVPQAIRPWSRGAGRIVRDMEIGVRNALARVHPRPVFILGNQKSGTTAIAALLARMCELPVTIDLRREIRRPTHPRVVSGGLPFDRYVRLNRWDFSRPLIKEPNLTHFYPELRRRFPESPIALVLRDPRDNLRSILNRLRIRGDLAALQEEDWRRVSPAWRLVLDGSWCGLEGDHYVEQLAERWSAFCDVAREHPNDVILCRYEDFLADKAGTIERLARSLGCTPVRDVSDQVDEQFQRRGDRSVAWDDFFGAENLGRIERICAERMLEFGYEPTLRPGSSGTKASS